tara:strand:- start:339 stop:515 length:177 start_codon:yes stop_codon:yes gene_type:complete
MLEDTILYSLEGVFGHVNTKLGIGTLQFAPALGRGHFVGKHEMVIETFGVVFRSGYTL